MNKIPVISAFIGIAIGGYIFNTYFKDSTTWSLILIVLVGGVLGGIFGIIFNDFLQKRIYRYSNSDVKKVKRIVFEYDAVFMTISKYIFIVVCICAFGLFIYPTLYKYDKLEKEYPVMINRITGETKILTVDGWIDSGDNGRAAEEVETYKKEISQLISNQNEDIKNSVLEIMRSEIENVKNEAIEASANTSEFDAVRNRDITNEEPQEKDINNTGTQDAFTLGDTKEQVKEVMGVPDSIIGGGSYTIWGYDMSNVTFDDKGVTGWSNISGNLLIK